MEEKEGLRPEFRIYPQANYYLNTKRSKRSKDAQERIKVEDRQIRRVHGIFLVEVDNIPSILLLKDKRATRFQLPGGKLKPNEDVIEGLKRKLTSKLAPFASSLHQQWQIAGCIGCWWKYAFALNMQPYRQSGSEFSECDMLFLVQLPEHEYFALPQNLEYIIVPFNQLSKDYGDIISSIPRQVSRFHIMGPQ